MNIQNNATWIISFYTSIFPIRFSKENIISLIIDVRVCVVVFMVSQIF